MYKILITTTAEKQLKKLSKDAQRKISAIIVSLGIEPRPYSCKKLSGTSSTYRIRVGDYRIIYDILKHEVIITILKIGHRRDVYK